MKRKKELGPNPLSGRPNYIGPTYWISFRIPYAYIYRTSSMDLSLPLTDVGSLI